MKTIYLVRHGETDWNREYRYQGRRDIPLSDVGHRQAQLIADYLRVENIGAVYSSPLTRTRDTAEQIARRHNLALILEESFQEIDFGEWEGYCYTELANEQQLLIDHWLMNPEDVPIPGGDHYPAYREKVLGGYQRIVDSTTDNIAIVTHAGVIRVIVAAVLEIPATALMRIRLVPSSLTLLSYDNRSNPYLMYLNTTCHLTKL